MFFWKLGLCRFLNYSTLQPGTAFCQKLHSEYFNFCGLCCWNSVIQLCHCSMKATKLSSYEWSELQSNKTLFVDTFLPLPGSILSMFLPFLHSVLQLSLHEPPPTNHPWFVATFPPYTFPFFMDVWFACV